MLVVMEEGASQEMIQAVIDRLVEMSFTVHRSTGILHTVLGGVGPEDTFEPGDFEAMQGVKIVTASFPRTSWPAAIFGPKAPC